MEEWLKWYKENIAPIVNRISIWAANADAPVIILTSPSKTPAPMKDNHIFHPEMITKEGVLKAPDWTKSSIYKAIVPLALLTYGSYN